MFRGLLHNKGLLHLIREAYIRQTPQCSDVDFFASVFWRYYFFFFSDHIKFVCDLASAKFLEVFQSRNSVQKTTLSNGRAQGHKFVCREGARYRLVLMIYQPRGLPLFGTRRIEELSRSSSDGSACLFLYESKGGADFTLSFSLTAFFAPFFPFIFFPCSFLFFVLPCARLKNNPMLAHVVNTLLVVRSS